MRVNMKKLFILCFGMLLCLSSASAEDYYCEELPSDSGGKYHEIKDMVGEASIAIGLSTRIRCGRSLSCRVSSAVNAAKNRAMNKCTSLSGTYRCIYDDIESDYNEGHAWAKVKIQCQF